MHLSPDQLIFWQYGFFKLNATNLFTWPLMLLLAIGSLLITRKSYAQPTALMLPFNLISEFSRTLAFRAARSLPGQCQDRKRLALALSMRLCSVRTRAWLANSMR